jgi:protein ImuA
MRAAVGLDPPAMRQGGMVALGAPAVDGWLGGGLARGSLHELFAAAPADAAALAGCAAGLACRAADGASMVWVRQGRVETEAGGLAAAGLAELGLAPDALLLVRARDVTAVLRAGLAALRCAALGAVIVEPWGAPRALDLTATRRLSLAAAASGVPCLLLRLAAEPRPSAAATRWRVAAAPSRPLAAHAPGPPAFELTLLRHRAGLAGRSWRLEWDRDAHAFRDLPPPSGAVAALPSGRAAAPPATPLRRAG